jgi:hypothetical protein
MSNAIYKPNYPSDRVSAVNFYSLLGSAHSAGLTIANLESNHIQSLVILAENGSAGLAARKAQNALCFHYDICYDMQGQPKSKTAARKPKL